MSMSNRKGQNFIVPHRSTEMFRRMLKKSASFVLSSQESSTYPEDTPSVLAPPAALLDSLFEHPA
jgi:hypothetical protein